MIQDKTADALSSSSGMKIRYRRETAEQEAGYVLADTGEYLGRYATEARVSLESKAARG